MVIAVCLNPCIDLTLTIPEYVTGGSFRAEDTRLDVCGKAVNTASALVNLGRACRLIGLNFTGNGGLLTQSLRDKGIDFDLTDAQGYIRTNVKVFERDKGEMTEINQSGEAVPTEAVEDVVSKCVGARGHVMVLSGSLPAGVAGEVYGRIVRGASMPVIADADGERLLAALDAGAYAVKPNRSEAERTFGVDLSTREKQMAFCGDLLKRYEGLQLVCLSLGAEGAVMADASQVLYAPAFPVTVRGLQGAGDAMVAGMAMGICDDAPLETILRYAMTAAAATVMRPGTQMCIKDDYNRFLYGN
jgi:1-phosphofructokinase